MIDLKPTLERIRQILNDGTDASIAYAALEARLALEKVCYDRLRQRHDYISHDQLLKCAPGAIVNTLMAEVDPHVAQTLTLSIGKNPGVPVEEDEYVEVGTEIGFDPKRMSKMWNALGRLALHVRLPKNRQDEISDYSDTSSTRAKVEEVLAELEQLAKRTMTFSDIGEEVSFTC